MLVSQEFINNENKYLSFIPDSMTLSATLPVTSVGNGAWFPGHLRHLGRVKPKLDGRLRDHFLRSCLNGLQHQRLFWQTPKTRNFSLEQTFALGKEAEDGFLSNMNEVTDEMFDDLLEKYGKVVFKRNDMKSPTDEVDDDSESLSFAVEMARVASDVKAADIKVLFVKPLVYWTRFFIIATAFSRPQIDAIGFKIRHLAETKHGKIPNGDRKPNSWTLLDFGDVVIHIFLPQQRAFYNLEEFYGNATPIDLPFERQQPPFRS